MVNVQQWLNQNYPDKNKTTKIKFSHIKTAIKNFNKKFSKELNLEDELVIDNFPNLQKIKLIFAASHRGLITKLTVNNCPCLTEINCPWNRIKEVKITNCPQISKLNFLSNYINVFSFNSLNPERLTMLNLQSNNFASQSLSFLINFAKLEELYIGNNETSIIEDTYNRFHGSLEPLKGMNNLRILNISNTNINDGVECLPEAIEEFRCYQFSEIYQTEVKKIFEQLRPFAIKPYDGKYDWDSYRSVRSANEIIEASAIQQAEQAALVELPQKKNNDIFGKIFNRKKKQPSANNDVKEVPENQNAQVEVISTGNN